MYARLRQKWPAADWQRLENAFGSGIPDVNGCIMTDRGAVEVWIECKIGRLTSDNTLTVDLKPRQRAWMQRRSNAGGSIYLAVGIGENVYITHACNLILVKNRDAREAWYALLTELEDFTLETI